MNHTIQMNQIAQHLANKGRHGDSVLVHMSPREVSGLQALARSNGTTLTINPETGLPEAFSLGSILPMAAGVALTGLSGGSLSPLAAGLITGGLGALTSGSLLKGLQMGMGAYGGAGLAGSLANLAAPAAEAATTSAPGFINPNAPSFAPSQNLFPYTSSADLGTSAGIPNISNVPYVAPTVVPAVPPGTVPGQAPFSVPTAETAKLSNAFMRAYDPIQALNEKMNWTGPGAQGLTQTDLSKLGTTGAGVGTGAASGLPEIYALPPYPEVTVTPLPPAGATIDQSVPEVSVQPSQGEPLNRINWTASPTTSGEHRYFGLLNSEGYEPPGLRYEKYDKAWYDFIGDSGRTDKYSLARPEQTVNWPKWYGTPIQSAIPVLPEVTDLPGSPSFTPTQSLYPYTSEATLPDTKSVQPSGRTPQQFFGQMWEGANRATKSPEEFGGFLKDNYMNVGLAAYPGLFASPARIQPGRSYINPYTLEVQNLSGSPVSPTGVENEGLRYRYVAQKPYLAAQGGIVAFARGGQNQEDTEGMMLPDSGRFDPTMQTNVLPRLNKDFNNYAAGGQTFAQGGIGSQPRFLSGGGDGMSDSIPATINDHDPARLADGEFIIPADVVSHLGNGSSKAGAERLYDMMDRIRLERTGKKRQAPKINVKKLMPA